MSDRRSRIRLLIVGVALVAILGVARLAIREISTGPLRNRIQAELSDALGLAVSVDRLHAAFLPTPHLRALGIRVANSSEPSEPSEPSKSPASADSASSHSSDFLTIERLDLGIEFWPLLEKIVVVDAFEVEGADVYLETDHDGRLRSPIDLDSFVSDDGEGSVRIELRRLNARRLRIFYRNDREDVSHSLVLHEVDLESEDLDSEISIRVHGELEGGVISVEGQVGSLAELSKPSRPFPIDVGGQIFEAAIEAKGSVREPWTLDGLDLELSGDVPEVVVERHSLPQIGVLHFSAHVSDLDGSFGVERFHLANEKTDPVRITADGKLDDLGSLKDIVVDVEIDSNSLDFLMPLLDTPVDFRWPPVTRLSTRLKLSDEGGRLDLEGTAQAMIVGETLVIRAEGGLHDLAGTPALDVRLDARADDLAPITSLFPDFPHHGPFGPIIAMGRLKGDEHLLAASGIDVRLGDRKRAWMDMKGSIENVVALQDVELALTFGAQSLHHLKTLLERDLPHTSKIEGTAEVSDHDGTLGLERLSLHGGEESPVEIHLDARVDDLAKRDEIEVELGLRGNDSQVLGALAGLDLPRIAPVEFHGKVAGSDEHVEIDDLTLQLAETRLLGNLSASFEPETRPSVRARITSRMVRLQDLGLTGSEDGTVSLVSIQPSSADDPIAESLLALRRVDLDLELRFDQVGGYRGLEASNLGFKIRLEDGELALTDAGADYQGGRLTTRLRADARTPDPTVGFSLETKALNLERLISQFDADTTYSGIVDAAFDLRARGDTLDTLRQSLTGHVNASMRDGNAASRIAREFVVNLSETIFPSLQLKETPSIGCAIVDLAIEDGIAQVRVLHLEGKEVGITGSGQVDLVHGLYDLHIVPKAYNPGILSVAPEVQVTGPLTDPTFHPMKRTLLTSFGKGLLSNALKPVGTLLSPFRSHSSTRAPIADACRLPSRKTDPS